MPTKQRQVTLGSTAVEELIEKMSSAIASGQTTVVKLAAATGLSRMQLYRIMDRENSPSLETAELIAKALGFSVSFSPKKKLAKRA